MIARTLAEIFSGGKIIWGLPSVFSKAISGKVGPIPVLVLIAASVDIIAVSYTHLTLPTILLV